MRFFFLLIIDLSIPPPPSGPLCFSSLVPVALERRIRLL